MQLAPVLDLSAAGPLWFELCAARGKPIEVDAAAVERLGGLCLQALLAAEKQWRADGVPFAIVHASQAFVEGVNLMAAHSLNPAGGNVT